MKKTIKIISILFLLISLIFSTTTYVQADIDIKPDEYKPEKITAQEGGRAIEMAGKILRIVRTLGVVAAMVVLSIIGLKYMLASLDEKANYKENMIPYIVGCALLVLCTTLPSIIYSIVQKYE
jgi:preprotein translocase subunit SecG